MNAKTLLSAVLVGFGWACAAAWGQEAPAPGVQPPPIKRDTAEVPSPGAVPPGAVPPGGVPGAVIAPAPSGLSDWILYRRPDCCSAGPCTPLYSEVYLRVGPDIPVGGSYLSRSTQTGWTLEGGVRGLLFNQEMTKAWVMDAGIVNSNVSAAHNVDPVPLTIFPFTGATTRQTIPVTLRNYNRTFVSLGFGREWYLWEPANSPGPKWRVGTDAGVRYGTSDATFNEIRHRTDTLYGVYTAIHTDVEVPCGCCFLSWGLRLEWADTWSHRVFQHEATIQDINVLATFGVRY